MEIYEIENFALESSGRLRPAKLAYETYGELNADKSNAVLYPTWFGGQHQDNEWLIGEGRALDPDHHFIIVPNMFGNGLSSSPSNTAEPYDRARFPRTTVRDNVNAQHRLVTEHLGVERLQLVLGWSMAASQTYQWAVSHPEMVARALPFCGSSTTSPHNVVFLEGLRAALTADQQWNGGWYDSPPKAGLRAFARVYAGWGFSQAFYWNETYRELGYDSLEDFIVGFWEGSFLGKDANDLLAMLWTWQHADAGGPDALSRITARTVAMPAEKDLYFPPEDEHWASRHIPNGEVRVIPGTWGHLAGIGINPTDVEFIDKAVRELLQT